MVMQLLALPVSNQVAASCISSSLDAEHERPLLTPGSALFCFYG
jgi:hypothetical protein